MFLIGFMAGRSMTNPLASYVMMFLAGILFGRVMFKEGKEQWGQALLIGAGYFLGYVIGSKNVSLVLLAMVFGAGVFMSFEVHKRGLLGDF